MTAITTSSPTGDASINALLSDTKWAAGNLTYSFPASASLYGRSYGAETTNMFGSFNGSQQSAARAALKMYASVSNLSFTEIAETSTQHADLRFGQSDEPSTAWAYFPTTQDYGGDVWVNHSSRTYASPHKGNYAYLTIMHEIGHALGLEHPHEGTAVMPLGYDAMEYTAMSYRSYVGASLSSGYTNEIWSYAQSLMIYDIAAVQHLYGANYATNSGSTKYTWSPTTGEMFINGVGQGAPGGNRIFQAIWDGGGSDTYDFTQYTTALRIDLEPGAWTTTSKAQHAILDSSASKHAAGNIANALLYGNDRRSLIEKAFGGSGSDTIKGNVASNTLRGYEGNDKLYGREGNDTLTGGSGRDKLYGQGGRDSLYGNSGSDTFVFQSTTDSISSAKDTIRDFVRGSDRIDLRGIDANTNLDGNQAFSFIGSKGFTKAGQLKFAGGVLAGDVNGDGFADLAIKVLKIPVLAKSDFYL